MSIRRKRRQRGKRKVLRREALKTWAILAGTSTPPEPDWLMQYLGGIGGMSMPIIRKVMPSLIAKSLVGVLPMTGPSGLTYDISNGIDPPYRYKVALTNKEYADERKRIRRAKKKDKKRLAETSREDLAQETEGLGQAC